MTIAKKPGETIVGIKAKTVKEEFIRIAEGHRLTASKGLVSLMLIIIIFYVF